MFLHSIQAICAVLIFFLGSCHEYISELLFPYILARQLHPLSVDCMLSISVTKTITYSHQFFLAVYLYCLLPNSSLHLLYLSVIISHRYCYLAIHVSFLPQVLKACSRMRVSMRYRKHEFIITIKNVISARNSTICKLIMATQNKS